MFTRSKVVVRLIRAALILGAVLASTFPALASPLPQGRPGRPADASRALRPRRMPVKDVARAVAPWRDPTRLVLKLVDGAKAHAVAGRLEAGTGGKDIITVQGLLESFEELRVETYVEVESSKLDVMRTAGEERAGDELADLSQYFLVRLGAGADVRWLVENLLLLPEVEEAYCLPRKITVAGDITPPVTNDLTSAQPQNGKYSFPWVAALPGGTGAGVTITDVEGNWNLQGMFGDTITHEDLQGLDAQSPPPAVSGTSTWVVPTDPTFDVHHGTAVLGILGADVDSSGMNGLVPGATLRVSGAHTTSGWKIADAIVKATLATGSGGVILLELQIGGPNNGTCSDPQNPPAWDRCCWNAQFGSLPIEFLSAEFNAIKQATALGLNVIEPAGNGEQDLDDLDGVFAGIDGPPCQAIGNSNYSAFDPNLQSSGAIVVGAGDSLFVPQRAWFSNYGRRVDACAQGMGLGTLAYGDLYNGGGDANQFYTQGFGGTSGASPIVTAAAAILGAAQNSYRGTFLYPAHALRLFLRSTGAPTINPSLDEIGEQPELKGQYLLQATGQNTALVFETQSIGNANLGRWVDGAGDIDDDGYGDILVSEPGYQDQWGSGRTLVLSGATGEIMWQPSWGGPGFQGPRVTGGGNFDGDDFADVILSDPSDIQPGNIGGIALVWEPWTNSLLQWTGQGGLGEQWGSSTDFLDVEGNGTDEILIGAKGWNGGRGRIYVYRNVLVASIDGEAAWPGLGHDVVNVGDASGDGISDFAASATLVSVVSGTPGKVYLFSGADRSVLWSWTDSGNNGFGASLAGGDANADGVNDVLVGMPFYSGIDAQRGRAVLYSGGDGSVLRTFDGYDAGGRFGWSVDGIGDVNGNGADDFLVSAYDERDTGPSNQVGAVHVFDGKAGKLLRSYRSEDQPGFNYDDYGFAAASAGDIDGDGRDDVLVGAPGWKDANLHGRVYTYLTPHRRPARQPRPGEVGPGGGISVP